MEINLPREAHVVLATPAYGGMCHIQYSYSCMQWAAFNYANGLECDNIFVFNEALIQRARNSLVTEFLKIPNATHLFFVDADISFRVEDYIRMLAEDKDIIVGAYPKKDINWDAVRAAAIAGKKKLNIHASSHVIDLLNNDKNVDFTKPFKIEHGGTGFMLIKRNVFEKLSKTTKKYLTNRKNGTQEDYNFFSVEIDNEGLLLSEDYYFCKKWREIGGDIWCAPWAELVHWGNYPFVGKYVDEEYTQ